MAATAYVRRATKTIPSALSPEMQHKARNDGRGRVEYDGAGGVRVAIFRNACATETTTSALAASQRRGGVMICYSWMQQTNAYR